jgi:hypothetical protein
MANLDSRTSKPEKRIEERKPYQVFAIIKPLNKESEEDISLAIDRSDSGAALVTHMPLPIGTRVEIRTGEDFIAIGEVADWNWDPQTDMVRLGMRLVEKRGIWPQE